MADQFILVSNNAFSKNWFYDKWVEGQSNKSYTILGIDWARPNTESWSYKIKQPVIKQCDCGAKVVGSAMHSNWCSSLT